MVWRRDLSEAWDIPPLIFCDGVWFEIRLWRSSDRSCGGTYACQPKVFVRAGKGPPGFHSNR